MDGATLRRARNMKQLTLEQLAERTKVSVTVLKAFENNDVDRLPARVYARGFLRSYAKEIGLDPDETVDEYFAQFENEPTLLATDDPSRAHQSRDLQVEPDTSRRFPVTPLVAGVAVLGFAIYFVFIAPRSAASRDETVQLPPPTRDVAPAATPPQPSAVAPAVAVQPPEAGETLRFNLTAEGPCWVSATADGKPALARLLEAGTQEALEAKDQLVLRVGDPGALKLSINGAPARPLGGAGQPVTVQITRDNFREFLAQPQ